MSIKRQVVKQLLSYKEKFPVLTLIGQRQSGKNTTGQVVSWMDLH